MPSRKLTPFGSARIMRPASQGRRPQAVGKSERLAYLHYIGHATVLVDIGQVRVLTDPILRDHLFFLQRHGQNSAPDLLKERAPDIVLISHLHYDHADLPSLRMLSPSSTIIAPKGSGKFLERSTGVPVHEVVEGDKVQVADVEITALPADHGNGHSFSRPTSPSLSYVMQNRLSVYFAGDTDLFEGMKEVGQDFDLDMALIPVWGYGHRLGEGHLTPFTAAQALNHLRPRVAVPIHWGSLRYWGPEALWKRADYLSQPPHLFAQHAGHLSPQTTVQVLQPGEGTALH